jgi:hypothetical protein
MSGKDGRRRARRFSATVADGGRGGVLVPVSFDPDAEWGAQASTPGRRHRQRYAGPRRRRAARRGARFPGPARLAAGVPSRRRRPCPGPHRTRGPQRADLADERGRASERQSDFGPVLDGLAQFYRRGYLRWIDATKRSPELRQQRIATMVELLEAGVKDYHEKQDGWCSCVQAMRFCSAFPVLECGQGAG